MQYQRVIPLTALESDSLGCATSVVYIRIPPEVSFFYFLLHIVSHTLCYLQFTLRLLL